MKRIVTMIAPLLAMLVLGIPGRAQGATGTTNVAVTVAVEASLTVTGTSTLTESVVGAFAGNFTGTTAMTYKVRTSKTGGSGTITAKDTTESSPAGGPNVGTRGTTVDSLARRPRPRAAPPRWGAGRPPSCSPRHGSQVHQARRRRFGSLDPDQQSSV